MVKKKVIFIDSDGTVMDSMTFKHLNCFGPAVIKTFHLEKYAKPILEKWNIINLYSLTRGINRFDGIGMLLEYVNDNFIRIDILEDYKKWLNIAKTKSNKSLEEYIMNGQINLKPILDWSNLTNQLIAKYKDEIKPFRNAGEAISTLAQEFKIIIISSANNNAVMHEWKKFNLLPYVDKVCTQEMGTKEDCIKQEMLNLNYDDAIMLGDAVGDLEAAKHNNISFYPIMPKEEDKSWIDFSNVYSKMFYNNTYNQVEETVISRFLNKLGKEK